MVKQAGNQGRGTRSDSKARGCQSTHFPPPLAATEFSSPQVTALSPNLCRLQGPVDDGPDAPAGKNEFCRGIEAPFIQRFQQNVFGLVGTSVTASQLGDVVRFGSMAVAETHQQSQPALVKL
jgi:hypothetical protein